MHMMCGMPLSPVECDPLVHVTASVDFFLRAYARPEPAETANLNEPEVAMTSGTATPAPGS